MWPLPDTKIGEELGGGNAGASAKSLEAGFVGGLLSLKKAAGCRCIIISLSEANIEILVPQS